MVELVPLNYDPFASPQQPSGTGLVALDYDPFAAPDQETTVGGHLAEVPGGVAAGAVGSVGTAMRGVAALTLIPVRERYGAYIDEIERISGTADDDSAEALGRAIKDDPDMHMWQRVLLSESLRRLRSKSSSSREQGAREIRYARQRLKAPKLDDHPFWRAGEAVSEWAEETFPAGKGYEQSLGREVGQGLGSLATGVAASALVGPIAGGVLFSAMGAGEAADRAVQAGATDEEIVRATAMGLGAGATDILPAEMLLRRLPLPGVRVISEAVKRFGGQRIARAIGRIGMQATVEAVQEGGQQVLQNLISREVHSPETVIMEGVEHGAGIGGIVGGIAGLAREGIAGIAGRRSRSARGARAKAVDDVPPPSPEDEASPIPTADIMEGREVVADAMAVDGVNQVLGEQGMPSIGTPVRLVRGREVMEGVVTDAWSGEDPGLTMESPDGDVVDVTQQELATLDAQLEVLPMPPSQEDIDKRIEEISTEAEQATADLERLAEKDAKEIGKAKERTERLREQGTANETALASLERQIEALEQGTATTPPSPARWSLRALQDPLIPRPLIWMRRRT